MAPRFTGGHAPPVKRIKAQTSDKFPDNRLHYQTPLSVLERFRMMVIEVHQMDAIFDPYALRHLQGTSIFARFQRRSSARPV